MRSIRHRFMRLVVLFATVALILGTTQSGPLAATKKLAIARIFVEFNASANDLGFHVFLDGEDWRTLSIINPNGTTIFSVEGKGPYETLGLTELFFEGAEPSLDEVPLPELLAKFPEGEYRFVGETVAGDNIVGIATLTHAIPAGPPNVQAVVGQSNSNSLVIQWGTVTGPPQGFPNRRIDIVGYQVIVGSFQVTVPATTTSVTVSPEFVASLRSGKQPFEVLAIEAGGNQTITEGSFAKH